MINNILKRVFGSKKYLRPGLGNKQAIALIQEKIKLREPYAFTRFGDGEIHVLLGNGSDDFNRKVCRFWGYSYPDQLEDFYRDAREIVWRAFLGTDLHGFMDPDCPIVEMKYMPDIWSLSFDYLDLQGINPEDLLIADHMLSRSREMGSFDGMRALLDGESFHIISPHVEKLQALDWEALIGQRPSFTLHPMEMNFRNRDQFINEFKNIKEHVVLMGVGLQKDYGIILRNKYGKVALDMGATIDAWSGIISRPWFKGGGLQAYLVSEKLSSDEIV